MDELRPKYLIQKLVNVFRFLRCDHEWMPRVNMSELTGMIKNKPRICPNCKSAYWDRERKNKRKNAKK